MIKIKWFRSKPESYNCNGKQYHHSKINGTRAQQEAKVFSIAVELCKTIL